jgi:hypothetical protein
VKQRGKVHWQAQRQGHTMTVAGTINDFGHKQTKLYKAGEGLCGGPGCLCFAWITYFCGVDGIPISFFLLFEHLQFIEMLMRYQVYIEWTEIALEMRFYLFIHSSRISCAIFKLQRRSQGSILVRNNEK